MIYFVFIVIVLEISAELFVISGLKKEIARFQAVSMLTATGFTTKESELILRHPVRRNIAVFLILFGVFSLAVIISTISNMMAESFRVPQLLGVSLCFGLVLGLVKIKAIHHKLTRVFHGRLQEEFALHELPLQEVLYTGDDDWITQVEICRDSKFSDQKLDDIIGPEEDILVLLIQRGHEKIRNPRLRNLFIHEGDMIILYGSRKRIEGKFEHELSHMKKAACEERNAVSIE
nr:MULTISPECIES: hypothetical protein [unclassified Paenibacillus]